MSLRFLRLLLWFFPGLASAVGLGRHRLCLCLKAAFVRESFFCLWNHCQQIENNTMKYTVQVPLGKPLQFPDLCPFTDTASPNSAIRLKRTSTSMVLPLPGAFLNSYTKTTFRFPARKKIVVLSVVLEAMIWLSLLGGIALCVFWLVNVHTSGPDATALLFLVGGLLAALGFRVARYWVLRRVRISPAWEGFIEVKFKSESYAKAFAELNRLAISAD